MGQVKWIRDKITAEGPVTISEKLLFSDKIKTIFELSSGGLVPSCYVWQGAKSKGKRKGTNSVYGSFRFRGKVVRAHVMAFAAFTCHKIEDGQHIDHICENSLCVNPSHLRALDASENCRLGAVKKKRK